MDRRTVLTGGVAVVAGTAASGVGRSAPATVRSGNAGRAFKAWVHGKTTGLETLRLLPLGPRSVLVRMEATQCCYSMINDFIDPPSLDLPRIPGHGGVGIVEEVGRQVTRVKIGDRVILAQTSQCGRCYNCLQDRADMCESKQIPMEPVAERADGTQVVADNNCGGMGEMSVAYEDFLIPVVTDVPPVELAMLHCVGGAGLSAALTFVPIEAGKNVAVVGCGPIGLSAVQGARIAGAKRIIAIEPIQYRRELAKKLGATDTLDPNVEGDGIIDKVIELCHGENASIFGGGRDWQSPRRRPVGADYVIEAAGSNRFPPKAGLGPDPTGVNIKALQQAYLMTDATGHVTTTGLYSGDVVLPAAAYSILGRTHHAGQLGGGANTLRDLPRFVSLIEQGLYDAKSLATGVYPLGDAIEAFQMVIDRAVPAVVITFPAH
jgi:S-(hydroxymethyl)glutathione dehydrogenase / alcohol dehydrogenase